MAILNSGEVNDVVSNFHMYIYIQSRTFWGVYHFCGLILWFNCVPVWLEHLTQWLEHCVSSAKVVGSIPREHM